VEGFEVTVLLEQITTPGVRGDQPVRVKQLVVHVAGDGKIPGDLRIVAPANDEPDATVASFEHAFDRRASVEGDPAVALAVLTSGARERLVELLPRADSVVCSDGSVRLRSSRPPRSKSRVIDYVLTALEIASQLSFEQDIAERLAANCATEPFGRVRMQILRVLDECFGPSDVVRAAAQGCLGERSPRNRWTAIQILGPSEPALDAAEELVLDATADSDLRGEAFRWLSSNADAARLREVKLACLSGPDDALRTEALREVMGWDDRPPFGDIHDALPMRDHESAKWLAALLPSDPASEPLFIRLLEWPHADVRLTAARWLARLGTRAAVEPLMACTSQFPRRALREAAADAIRTIQSRLGAVDAGRVSLVEVDASGGTGGLSLSADSGALSTAGAQTGGCASAQEEAEHEAETTPEA
jgi:hypothetical protein